MRKRRERGLAISHASYQWKKIKKKSAGSAPRLLPIPEQQANGRRAVGKRRQRQAVCLLILLWCLDHTNLVGKHKLSPQFPPTPPHIFPVVTRNTFKKNEKKNTGLLIVGANNSRRGSSHFLSLRFQSFNCPARQRRRCVQCVECVECVERPLPLHRCRCLYVQMH